MGDNHLSLKQNCPLQTATPVEDALTEDLDETRMRANEYFCKMDGSSLFQKNRNQTLEKKKKSCEFAIHNMVLARFLFQLMADLMHHSFIFNVPENDTSPRNFIISTLLVMIIYDAHSKISIISNLGTSFHVS